MQPKNKADSEFDQMVQMKEESCFGIAQDVSCCLVG